MVDLLLDDLINGRQAVIEVLIVKQLLVGGLEQAITTMVSQLRVLGACTTTRDESANAMLGRNWLGGAYPALVSVRIKRGMATVCSPDERVHWWLGGGKQQLNCSSICGSPKASGKKSQERRTIFLHQCSWSLQQVGAGARALQEISTYRPHRLRHRVSRHARATPLITQPQARQEPGFEHQLRSSIRSRDVPSSRPARCFSPTATPQDGGPFLQREQWVCWHSRWSGDFCC